MSQMKPLQFLKIIALSLSLSVAALAQRPAGDVVQFSLTALNGPPVTSESLHGEVVVLAFGASWLPLSKNQLQSLKKLADAYADRGVVVYWVSTESESPRSRNYASNEQLRALAQRNSVSVLRDPDGEVSHRLGIDQIPAIVILNKQGELVGDPIKGSDSGGNLATQVRDQLQRAL